MAVVARIVGELGVAIDATGREVERDGEALWHDVAEVEGEDVGAIGRGLIHRGHALAVRLGGDQGRCVEREADRVLVVHGQAGHGDVDGGCRDVQVASELAEIAVV